MRRVVSAETVAHLWANRALDDARTTTRNFYFDGPAIYSYGSHFVVGCFMPDDYGRVVLMNSASYSNTTNKHKSYAARAIRNHGRIVYVPGIVDDDIRAMNSHGCARIVATLEKAARDAIGCAVAPRIRAATVAAHLSRAAEFIADARELASIDAKRKALSKEDRAKASRIIAKYPPNIASMEKADAEKLARVLSADEFAQKAEECNTRGKAHAERAAALEDASSRAGTYSDARVNFEHAAAHFRLAGMKAQESRAVKRAKECAVKQADARRIADAEDQAKALEIAQRMANAPTLREFTDICPPWARARWHDDGSLRDANRTPEYVASVLKAARDAMGEAIAEKLEQRRDELNALENARYVCAARSDILERIDTMRHNSRNTAPRAQILANAEGWRKIAGEIARICREYDNPESVASLSAAIAEDLKQAAEAAAEAEAGRADAWRVGGTDSFDLPCGSAALRIREGRIETSRGAYVPLSVAPFVWRVVNKCRANNTAHEFGNDAPMLGSFRLTRIDAAGSITVGCHFISFDELRRIARALGYDNA